MPSFFFCFVFCVLVFRANIALSKNVLYLCVYILDAVFLMRAAEYYAQFVPCKHASVSGDGAMFTIFAMM